MQVRTDDIFHHEDTKDMKVSENIIPNFVFFVSSW